MKSRSSSRSSTPLGVVAAGHEKTVQAAREILEEGGNAFDAIIAAHLAACVAEPVLSSPAGGGFMLAHTSGEDVLYDFFVQTPRNKRPVEEIEFFPITADFGSTMQEFHIGLGSMATPGTVNGLFGIHRQLGSMPMARLARPAIEMARDGVVMNTFQAYILDIVQAVYRKIPGALEIFGSRTDPGSLIREGELHRQPELADTLETLAAEGEDFFTRGEIAQKIRSLCSEVGGHLSMDDFEHYEVIRRKPLRIRYRNAEILSNPPPSSGGLLNAFALKLMDDIDIHSPEFENITCTGDPGQNTRRNQKIEPSPGSAGYSGLLAQIQELTDQARIEAGLNMLDPEFLKLYHEKVRSRPRFSRGTTHISIMDRHGNMASLTTSNGEGCGHILPGTGIMLNNMLGEEDLNPGGFHRWPENQRMSSMMSPTMILMPGGRKITLGSGGSNRLRTAILQVILNIVDFGMPLDEAVKSPRIHCERGILSVEGGFDPENLQALLKRYPDHKVWSGRNLFFGGVHAASHGPEGFEGSGDPRRGGNSVVVRPAPAKPGTYFSM